MTASKEVVDAEILQREYGFSRAASYAIMHQIGVRVSPRRIVVLRSRLEEYLAGQDRAKEPVP